MAEEVNLDELQANLQEYRQQLEQVGALLLDDPDNEEYKGIYESLTEVIQLTADLLSDAGVSEQPAADAGTSAAHAAAAYAAHAAPPTAEDMAAAAAAAAGASHPVAAITAAPDLRLPSVLPPQVAQQIRVAQQRAAMAGQAPPSWAIGAKCQAVYSGDGQWYNGVVEAVSVSGAFIVAFDGYDSKEEVQPGSVRPCVEVDETGYKGVSAPKRRKVDEEAVITEMPKWLEIKPTDDEKTKAKKKKLQKSYKSKLRFHKMDTDTKNKAEAWKSFMTGKGAKKKKGFLTGTKKESMFKVPEGVKGKVGVVGSGQGMTGYVKRKRHDFAGEEAGFGGLDD